MRDNVRINVIVNLIRTFVLTLLSFITFPWVCRALGDEALGTYTWALTFVAYFLILAKIGIPNLAVRECVKVRDDKEKLSNKAQSFFMLQLITTVISFGLMCIVVFSVPEIRNTKELVFILSLNFLTGAFSFEWIFIALEKQFYMSVRSIVVLALAAIGIISLVSNPDDVYIYAFISISVTILTTICNLIYVRKFITLKKSLPYNYKEMIKPLVVLCTLSFTLSLYNQTDTFILGFIDKSKAEVGSYSVGIKGIDIIIGVMSNLSTVFIPRSAYYYEKEDKRFFNNLTRYSFNICLFIVLPAIVTMSVLSKPICSLISGNYDFTSDTSYASSYWVLIALSAMMLTYSLGEMIYGQVLLPMKKEKYYLIAIVVGTLVNAVLSIVLGGFVFKDTPAIGVAIGTVATDICIFIFLLAMTWKWVKGALFNKNTLKLILANILVLVASLLLYNPLLNAYNGLGLNISVVLILQMVTIVFIDLIIYLGTLLLVKEDLVYSFIRKTPKEV